MTTISSLQRARAAYQPQLPPILASSGPFVDLVEGERTASVADQEVIHGLFPHTYGLPQLTFAPGTKRDVAPTKIGVVLSGGQAPGGHNVIAGLLDALLAANPDNELLGFRNGASGLIDASYRTLTREVVDAYRNTGGFDIIGSGRKKIEKPEQFDTVAKHCATLGISGLVIIGGDDSNTNACVLAEYMLASGIDVRVVGCPKTIDGDLKNAQVETSFGFDTTSKVYAELIGNIERDALSARKYWHFVKLMGRSASHVALECALQAHPNLTLISEEVAGREQTLAAVVEQIAALVRDRAAAGKNFGVILIPEGLIEFLPDMKALIAELNELMATHHDRFLELPTTDDKFQFVNAHLTPESGKVFHSLPGTIARQMLLDRDPSGNFLVSQIETEKLLIDLVGDLLGDWAHDKAYVGSFSPIAHFLGYEGRCAPPSNFDANYCYGLGYAAAALLLAGKTGYMTSIRNTARPVAEWVAGAVPLTMMMNVERRRGAWKPVIRKALVDLEGRPFQTFAANREAWAMDDDYAFPGPIQYFGPSEVCDPPSMTLRLEQGEL